MKNESLTKPLCHELFVAGFALLMCGFLAPDSGLYLSWWGVGFITVGLGYHHFGPSIFGKTYDGGRKLLHRIVLLPYLISNYLCWYCRHLLLSKEDAYNEIAPGIWLGRRPLDSELPKDITTVVDLTSEFTASQKIRGLNYICVPTLDGDAPPAQEFKELITRLAKLHDEKVYIHCAAGHGRSAAVAVAVLVERCFARDLVEAEELIKRRRPLISIKGPQRALLNEWFAARKSPGDLLPPPPPQKTSLLARVMDLIAKGIHAVLLGSFYLFMTVGTTIVIGVLTVGAICKYVCEFYHEPVGTAIISAIVGILVLFSWAQNGNQND